MRSIGFAASAFAVAHALRAQPETHRPHDQLEHLTIAQRNAQNAKLASYAHRPLAFLFRFIRRHPLAHAIVLCSVFAAVGCALASQYAIKHLIDVLGEGRHHPGPLWGAFAILVGLIAADNLLWRVGGWVAAHTFVAVTGDLRRDLFQYLSGHSPTYYSEKQPGMLASRITATSNAVYTAENTTAWNVLPPCIAVLGAIVMITAVNPLMAGGLMLCSAILSVVLYRLAGRGSARHHHFATKAASVDGELVDVISNMGARARLRHDDSRAAAFRRDRQSGNGRAPAEPAVSGKAAPAACGDHRAAVGGLAGLGAVAVGSRPCDLRRHRAGQLTRLHDSARHTRSGRGAGRCHAARRAARGSRSHPAGAARHAGSRWRHRARAARRPGRFRRA